MTRFLAIFFAAVVGLGMSGQPKIIPIGGVMQCNEMVVELPLMFEYFMAVWTFQSFEHLLLLPRLLDEGVGEGRI